LRLGRAGSVCGAAAGAGDDRHDAPRQFTAPHRNRLHGPVLTNAADGDIADGGALHEHIEAGGADHCDTQRRA